MKRFLAVCSLLLVAGQLFAGTRTSRLNLYKPTQGETGWANAVNDNFNVIDSSVAVLSSSMTQTFSTTIIFSSGVSISSPTFYQVKINTPTATSGDRLDVNGLARFYAPTGGIVYVCDVNAQNCSSLESPGVLSLDGTPTGNNINIVHDQSFQGGIGIRGNNGTFILNTSNSPASLSAKRILAGPSYFTLGTELFSPANSSDSAFEYAVMVGTVTNTPNAKLLVLSSGAYTYSFYAGNSLTSAQLTVSTSGVVAIPALAANECVQTTAGGVLTTSGAGCGSGGGGGSSSLATSQDGVRITSPTANINFGGGKFLVTLGGSATAQVLLVSSAAFTTLNQTWTAPQTFTSTITAGHIHVSTITIPNFPINVPTYVDASGNLNARAIDLESTSDVDGVLPSDFGGTGHSLYEDGQLLIGNSSTGRLSTGTITAGSNITVTNGPGTITIASTGGGGVVALPLPGGATNYIQNSSTLQSGATAYPSFLYAGSSITTPAAVVGDGSVANPLLIKIKSGTSTNPTILLEGAAITNGDGIIDYYAAPGTHSSRLRVTNINTNSGTIENRSKAGWNFESSLGKVGAYITNPTASAASNIVINATGSVRLYDGGTLNYVALRSSSTNLHTQTYWLPSTTNTVTSGSEPALKFLGADSNGNAITGWGTDSTGSASPGGTTQQLQYNSTGTFAGLGGSIVTGSSITLAGDFGAFAVRLSSMIVFADGTISTTAVRGGGSGTADGTGYALEPATVTIQANKGISASTMVVTSSGSYTLLAPTPANFFNISMLDNLVKFRYFQSGVNDNYFTWATTGTVMPTAMYIGGGNTLTSEGALRSRVAGAGGGITDAGMVNLWSTSGKGNYVSFNENGVANNGTVGFAAGSGDLLFKSGAEDITNGTIQMRVSPTTGFTVSTATVFRVTATTITVGSVLVWPDGSKSTSSVFGAGGGGSAVPGGSTQQLQYNSTGTFAGLGGSIVTASSITLSGNFGASAVRVSSMVVWADGTISTTAVTGGGGGSSPSVLYSTATIQLKCPALDKLETNFAVNTATNTGTSNYITCSFDNSTRQYANGFFMVPNNLDTAGTITIRTYGRASTAAASKAVGWILEHQPLTNGEDNLTTYLVSASSGLAVSASQGFVDSLSWNMSVSSSTWSANDVVNFRFARDVGVTNNLASPYFNNLIVIEIPVTAKP